jgi:ribosomal protein L12E/L44/L45/RPP1/RPP2
VPDSLDSVLDTLDSDGITVMTKEIKGDAKEMARRANEMFTRGKYDMVVALTDNPFAANIAFNKLEGTSAAICESVDDATVAKDNEANVIIIKNPNDPNLSEILGAAMKKPGMFASAKPRPQRVAPVAREAQPRPQKPKAVVQKEEPQQDEEPEEEEPAPNKGPGFRMPDLFKPKPAQPVEQEQEDEQELDGPKRRGVAGWIKDELGIIDENPQPQEEAEESSSQPPTQQPLHRTLHHLLHRQPKKFKAKKKS